MKDPVIYTQLQRIEGPLVAMLIDLADIGYGEAIQLVDLEGQIRKGRVVAMEGKNVTIELFQGTTSLPRDGVRIQFLGKPITLKLDPRIIGRTLNGMGIPIDGGPPLAGEDRDITSAVINPTARAYPREFIQTGISCIDLMNSLVRGQKLPIFSSSGMPHDQLAIQIAQQARIRPDLSGQESEVSANEELVVVFAAIGVKHDVAVRFAEEIPGRTVTFLNLADDPVMERLLTPRAALTAAEYLAFDLGLHVLVILTDMTVYGEALREVASARGDVPSRKGYPGYLYSDLASLFERAGQIKGKKGSITQIPILTMPNNDITHPIPDLTGYITEGQIVLSRDLNRQNIYPPIELLPSLSRLMSDGVGHGYTKDDHLPVMEQLYAAYAHCAEVRMMSRIMGEDDLSLLDKQYLQFGDYFESHFVAQGDWEDRSIEQSIDIGWQCLKCLPKTELTRLSKTALDEHDELWDP